MESQDEPLSEHRRRLTEIAAVDPAAEAVQSVSDRDSPASNPTLATPLAVRDRLTGDSPKVPPGQVPGPPSSESPTIGLGGEAAPSQDLGFTVRFGDYDLLEELGRGGMGVVYKARQRSLNRLVALKMIRTDRLPSAADFQRFRHEAEAAAHLDHPNITPIYTIGEHEGRCYFTMKLIEGGSLDRHLARFAESPRAAVQLMAVVAEALCHAHRRGIFHRDLKPSNILLDSEGRPVITDFGLAKQLAVELDLTTTGEVIGTPPYMAPEQVRGGKEAIPAATDVYGLGAVLYTLLMGRPPITGRSILEVLQQVCTREPDRPRHHNRRVDRDLETICLKCLEKDPLKRYSCAGNVFEDMQRWLAGQPIRARAVGPITRLWRWCRRYPFVAITLPTVATLLAISLWFNARLNQSLSIVHQQQEASQAQELALRTQSYLDNLRLASEAWRASNVAEARVHLAACIPHPGQPDIRSFPWWILWHAIEDTSRILGTFDEDTDGAAVAVDPKGEIVASGEPDGVIRLRTLPEGKLVAELRGHAKGPINCLHFSSDTNRPRLVSGSDDGTVRVWDVKAARQLHALEGHKGWVATVRFLGRQSEAVASGGDDHVIRIWDSHSDRLLRELSGHTRTVRSLEEQPGAERLFSSAEDGTIRIWDWKTGRPDLHFPDGKWPVPAAPDMGWARSICLSPGESELAAGMIGPLLRWDARPDDGRFGRLLWNERADSTIRTMAWRDNQSLALGLTNGKILIHTVEQNRGSWQLLPGHSHQVFSLVVVPGKKDLVSISMDGTIRYWPASAINGQIYIAGTPDPQISRPAWNGSLVTACLGPDLVGYRMPQAAEVFRIRAVPNGWWSWSAVSPDTTRAYAVEVCPEWKGLATIRVNTGERASHMVLPDDYRRDPGGIDIPNIGAISPDGQQILLGLSEELCAIDLPKSHLSWIARHPHGVHAIAYLPGTEEAATACQDGKVRFWNTRTGILLRQFAAYKTSADKLAVSSDGTLLATWSGGTYGVVVWRTADFAQLASFRIDQAFDSIYFVDHGRTLVTLANDTLSFWSVPERIELMRWTDVRPGSSLSISPDQSTLVLQNERNLRLLRGAPNVPGIQHPAENVPHGLPTPN